MGWKLKGGGFINGIPIRDIPESEYQLMNPQARQTLERSSFYERADDATLEPQPKRSPTRLKNILLVCPTYRLEPETIDRIHRQQWSHGALDFFFTRDNPHSEGYLNIEHNMNKARRVLLTQDYDAMFVVESDMLPPYDALERLAQVEADVAGGLYVMRQWHLATNVMAHDPSNPHNRTAIPLHQLKGLDLIRTNGVSCGCALIRKDVLKEISFRAELPLPPDSPFMTDCNEAGFVTVCDLTVVCGHKTEDGKALYPEF